MLQRRPHYLAPEVKTMNESPLKIFPKDLSIIWGSDDRYWRLPSQQTGWAELVQVCWLEVNGVVNVKPGRYRISFTVSLKPDSFGWNGCKPFVMAKVGKKGNYCHKPANLSMSETPGEIVLPNTGDLDIVVPPKEGSDMNQLHFGLYEVWSGKWKGGLKIYYATIEKIRD